MTTDTTPDMPPLPQPTHPTHSLGPLWSAEQMREYGLACIAALTSSPSAPTESLGACPSGTALSAPAPSGRPLQSHGAWISVDQQLPDNGGNVLAHYVNANGHSRVVRAFYAAPKTIEANSETIEYEAAEYDEEEDTYWLLSGWYESNAHEEVHWAVDERVTDWMPLPSAPTTGEQA